jgi:hypothetical protein
MVTRITPTSEKIWEAFFFTQRLNASNRTKCKWKSKVKAYQRGQISQTGQNGQISQKPFDLYAPYDSYEFLTNLLISSSITTG